MRLVRWSVPCLLLLACSSTPRAPKKEKPAEAPAESPPVAEAPAPDVRARVATTVLEAARDFRRVLFLLDGAWANDERHRVTAWLVHERNQERLDGLMRSVLDVASEREAFLEVLESDPALHDADKLAFRDVLDALPTSERVAKDRAALSTLEQRYEAELQKALASLGTRGFVIQREAWDDYMAFVRKQHGQESLLDEFRAEWEAMQDGARGPAPWRDDAEQIVGRSLPEKSVVLTFDDGPAVKRTAAVLEVLRRFGAHAVFFQVGRNVEHGEAASRMVLEAGHTLGNHSFSHACLPKLDERALEGQLDRTNRALSAVTKGTNVLFRPPYGARNASVLEKAKALGMRTVLWNVDSRDWADPVPSSIALRVLQDLEREKRGIILFHDIHERTAEALPIVLEKLVAQGYKFYVWNGAEFAPDATRGDAPAASVQLEPDAPLYRESWAVVVGINDYAHWPKLSYAVHDAEAVRDVLVERYGFAPDHVTLLKDGEATRARVMSALSDDLINGGRLARDDRVFVFFAGHGVTRALPNGKSQGYLVPVDADATNLQSQAISMAALQEASDALPAKHAFFVMDACYSGLALTRGGAAQASRDGYLREITRRGTREVLTAGGADEQVADNGPGGHSIFTWTLLEGLEGKADLDGDAIITATELSAYVAPSVSALSRQTPVFGHLVGSEGGEFVFVRRAEADFLDRSAEQNDARATELTGELASLKQTIDEERKKNQELERKLRELSAALERDHAEVPRGTRERALEVRRELDRGMTLYKEKRYDEALAAFTRMVELDPLDALATNNIGFVHTKLGHHQEALTWYEKTVAIDPARAIAWVNLGDAYVELGRKAEARAAYQRYLGLLPNGKLAADVRRRLATVSSGARP